MCFLIAGDYVDILLIEGGFLVGPNGFADFSSVFGRSGRF